MKESICSLSNLMGYILEICAGFFLAFALLTSVQMREMNRINAGYITDNAITFSVSQDIALSAQEISELLLPTCMLFEKSTDFSSPLKLFSFAGQPSFSLTSGRLFRKDDLETVLPLMLAGQKLSDDEIYSMCDEIVPPRIIGQLGFPLPSMIDYQAVYLPPKAARTFLHKGTWIIDGDHGVLKSFTNVREKLGEQLITVYSTNYTGTQRMYGQNEVLPIILYGIFFAMLVTYLLSVYSWLGRRSHHLQILFICGSSTRKMWKALHCTQHLSSMVVLSGIGALACWITQHTKTMSLLYQLILAYVLFVLIFFLLFLIIFILYALTYKKRGSCY